MAVGWKDGENSIPVNKSIRVGKGDKDSLIGRNVGEGRIADNGSIIWENTSETPSASEVGRDLRENEFDCRAGYEEDNGREDMGILLELQSEGRQGGSRMDSGSAGEYRTIKLEDDVSRRDVKDQKEFCIPISGSEGNLLEPPDQAVITLTGGQFSGSAPSSRGEVR
jgi:hypothetical protein